MAQLITGTLLPAAHQERLSFLDIFGSPYTVYLNISAGPSRSDMIASTLVMMNAREAATTAYAAANGHDLTADLASGAAVIAAALAAAAPVVVTPTPTPTVTP